MWQSKRSFGTTSVTEPDVKLDEQQQQQQNVAQWQWNVSWEAASLGAGRSSLEGEKKTHKKPTVK